MNFNWRTNEGKNLIFSFLISSFIGLLAGLYTFYKQCTGSLEESIMCDVGGGDITINVIITFGFIFGLTLIHYQEFLQKIGLALLAELLFLTSIVFYLSIFVDAEILLTGLFFILFSVILHLTNFFGMVLGSAVQKLFLRLRKPDKPTEYRNIKY